LPRQGSPGFAPPSSAEYRAHSHLGFVARMPAGCRNLAIWAISEHQHTRRVGGKNARYPGRQRPARTRQCPGQTPLGNDRICLLAPFPRAIRLQDEKPWRRSWKFSRIKATIRTPAPSAANWPRGYPSDPRSQNDSPHGCSVTFSSSTNWGWGRCPCWSALTSSSPCSAKSSTSSSAALKRT
jgi:hypothetical protein